MRRRATLAIAAACVAATLTTGPARALTVTIEECGEGGDFVRNAALSRDGGYPPEKFLAQMEHDFEWLRSVPRELRWFVRDDDDERLLRTAVLEVFASPRPPESHRLDFMRRCRAEVAMAVAPDRRRAH